MDDPDSQTRRQQYEWTPRRIVAGVLIVAAAGTFIAWTAHREIGSLRESLRAQATYETFTQWTEASPGGGFNFDDLIVPRERIAYGGPPKDGIPALNEPQTVPVAEADHLRDDDRVIGVSVGGESRAYPIRGLMYHEAVNDVVGAVPIAAIYCPLCDSVSVVDRRLEGRTYTFGISGLLLHSNVLLFDRTDDALWSQLGFTAISGPNAGKSLEHLPWELSTFADWRRVHPDSTVMTFDTGYGRNYETVPYGDYFETDRLIFPVDHEDDRLSRKTPIVGVKLGDAARAYPARVIREAPEGIVRDTIGGERVVLRTDPTSGSVAVIEAPPGAQVAHTYWFSWAAFHPETEIYGSPP